eukprot:3173515-Amphidinium_carterae.1
MFHLQQLQSKMASECARNFLKRDTRERSSYRCDEGAVMTKTPLKPDMFSLTLIVVTFERFASG